jgi:hypothetical protein
MSVRLSTPSKAIDWLNYFAPPEAAGMNFSEAGPIPAQGGIAQQMFWYTAFTADMVGEGACRSLRRRHAALAHGAQPAWRLLAGRPEDRLSGRRFLDADAVDPGRSCSGGVALRPVRHLDDRRSSEVPCGPDVHPRVDDQPRSASPSVRLCLAAWSSSTARPPACSGRPPAPTFLTIRVWRSCGGRTSGMRPRVRCRHRKRWTISARSRSVRAFRGSAERGAIPSTGARRAGRTSGRRRRTGVQGVFSLSFSG